MTRSATIQRKTNETQVELSIDLDGSGTSEVSTGVGFFDHMLTLLARHSLIDLRVVAEGDLQIDQHHTVEDVGICFGRALAEALGEKRGIRRYGSIALPMEESLVTAAVDVRPGDIERDRLLEGDFGKLVGVAADRDRGHAALLLRCLG